MLEEHITPQRAYLSHLRCSQNARPQAELPEYFNQELPPDRAKEPMRERGEGEEPRVAEPRAWTRSFA